MINGMKVVSSLKSLAVLSFIAAGLFGCKYDTGRVVDSRGDPVPGATILFGTSHGKVLIAVPNSQGEFVYPSTEIPLSMMTVDAQGYAQITERVGKRFTFVLEEDLLDDSDWDLLSDFEESRLGTDPNNPDTDGDGLLDSLESRVMFPEAIVTMGVNPLHKDLLVEVDWDDTYPTTKITDVAVGILKASFRNSPIGNPDGRSGINLIVDKGQFGGGSGTDRQAMAPSRQNIFYHTSSDYDLGSLYGYADLPGRNNYIRGDFSAFGVGEGFVEAIVWMHELGHNLDLRHGGDDEVLCKPNYVSVMNYNPFMALSFSYSRGNRPTLDENYLDERLGIGFGPVDWNGNFKIDDFLVAQEINGHTPINLIQWLLDGIDESILPIDLAQALNPERCVSGYTTNLHHDHNDWAVVESRLDDDLPYVLDVISITNAVYAAEATTAASTEVIFDEFEFPAQFTELMEEVGLDTN